MKCPKCGMNNYEWVRVCRCGYKLTPSPTASSHSAPTTYKKKIKKMGFSLWHCRDCRKGIRLFEKHHKIKKGQNYLYIRKGTFEYGGFSGEAVRVGTVSNWSDVKPGRLCMACWHHWQESQRQVAARKAQLEQAEEQVREQRIKETETVDNAYWVLDNMPIASSKTLLAYVGLTNVSRDEILALGKNQVRRGMLRYTLGSETVTFYASSGGIYYEWIIVRTDDKSWGIADSKYEYTD